MARGISSIFYEPFCLEKDFVQKFSLDLYALVHREMLASSTTTQSLCRKGEKHPLCVGRIGVWTVSVWCTKPRLAKLGQPAALMHCLTSPILACFRLTSRGLLGMPELELCMFRISRDSTWHVTNSKQPRQRAESPQSDYISASQHLFLNPLFFFKAVRQIKWLWYIM